MEARGAVYQTADLNDKFELKGEYDLTGCVDLQIFNRWGTLVYASSDNNASWDGRTFAGETVPDGVYFYILEINGWVFQKSVTVTR